MKKKTVKVGGIYKDRIYTSMLPKEVIRVHNGIVTTANKKYMSDEHCTYPEQQFLRDKILVS